MEVKMRQGVCSKLFGLDLDHDGGQDNLNHDGLDLDHDFGLDLFTIKY